MCSLMPGREPYTRRMLRTIDSCRLEWFCRAIRRMWRWRWRSAARWARRGWRSRKYTTYATDASNYRQLPVGVVLPRDPADVEMALAECRALGAAVLPRGGGTSLAGQCANVAVVFDFSRHMNGLVSIDPAAKLAVVQPGIVLDRLRDAAEKYE